MSAPFLPGDLVLWDRSKLKPNGQRSNPIPTQAEFWYYTKKGMGKAVIKIPSKHGIVIKIVLLESLQKIPC